VLVRTKNATAEVRRYYNVDDFLLGQGAFGKVFRASSKTDANAKYAIKILPMTTLSESTKLQMEQEITVLAKLDHAYIAKYAQSFQDEKYIYIIMPLIDG
jgi:calcium-dependent protein kinase